MFTTKLEPESDLLLSATKLGHRWDCHPKVALRRAKGLGIPLVRFNSRVHAVRLSDVIRVEQEATVAAHTRMPNAEPPAARKRPRAMPEGQSPEPRSGPSYGTR